MELDKDNANPTILNASDLPSRRQKDTVKPRSDGGTGLFDGLIPSNSYLQNPLDQSYSSSSSSDEEEEDEPEEIDEQEIYGEFLRQHHL